MSQCEQNHNHHEMCIETIYADFDGFIRSVIAYAAKNYADREDIYQEVFLTLSQKEDFSGIANIKGYLYRLIVNKVNELARKRVAANQRLRKYVQRKVPAEDISCEEDAMTEEEVRKTFGLIKEYLSEKESEAILLRFRDGCDNGEAAIKMNVQKETLTHYISVGLKKIRDIVKSQRGPE